jgi:hypothetical protein
MCTSIKLTHKPNKNTCTESITKDGLHWDYLQIKILTLVLLTSTISFAQSSENTKKKNNKYFDQINLLGINYTSQDDWHRIWLKWNDRPPWPMAMVDCVSDVNRAGFALLGSGWNKMWGLGRVAAGQRETIWASLFMVFLTERLIVWPKLGGRSFCKY